ncbi:MAG: efflux RND transporter periplasmic adaptor subunit [Planctomycetes bacterium]|nr:efflux RND transporter periplasmic adaptor subunit [Planctomycetota bacterium]
MSLDQSLPYLRLRRGIAWVQIVMGLVLVIVVLGLMAWLMGFFAEKVEPGTAEAERATLRTADLDDTQTATVELITTDRFESAVGTIRAVHETSAASKLLAKVIEVNAVSGHAVAQGDVIARLERESLEARLAQAEAAVAASQALRGQAQINFKQIEQMRSQGAATQTEMDKAVAALEAAKAEVIRAERARDEAETILAYTVVTAPIDGIIIDRAVEVGDTVSPGQVICRLYDPTRMQMVAEVRESLAHRLEVGQSIVVRIDALNKDCIGAISEIVPRAEASSRTFQVKVTGPCPPDIYSGMFGRLNIPLGTEELLVIPAAAVMKVGQLDMVDVYTPATKQLHRRVITLGRTIFDGRIEVLSGLTEGDVLALAASVSLQEADQ